MAGTRDRAQSEDVEVLRAKLAASVGPVLYSDLAAHLKRDAVIVVARSLSIVDCGVAVAIDDVAAIGGWLERGELGKPTAEDLIAWSGSVDRRWLAIVVQPYVLVQDPPDA